MKAGDLPVATESVLMGGVFCSDTSDNVVEADIGALERF